VRRMEVVGVRVEMPSNSPIVLLKEEQGDRYLPIWIGAVEATAIAFAQQGMVSLRPLTHDLFKDVLEVLNVQLRTVKITSLRDGIFYADLVFSNGAEVSARPSDSIALALRTGAAIFATDEILDEAGVAIPDEQEDEVEKFREFLDQISPEDFGRSALGPRPGLPAVMTRVLPGSRFRPLMSGDAPGVIVDVAGCRGLRCQCRSYRRS
jgi:uncharacterized protein